MRHGSLFSGIGGFDLAADWMGWNNVFHCEWSEFPRQVLKYHFPNSISYEDITNVDFRPHRGHIDLITGGFPCQPFSVAGKRKGTEDPRYLWEEMLRAIREIQPSYIVAENVLGLVNWDEGMVFDKVQTDLESEGFEVQPFVLPAAGVNAPHRRNRVWFVAYSNNRNDRRTSREDERESPKERIFKRNEVRKSIEPSEVWGDATDNNERNRKEERFQTRGEVNVDCIIGNRNASDTTSSGRKEDNRQRESRLYYKESSRIDWQDFPTEPPICGGDDGLPTELDRITFSKWRAESIKAYGNAIVPQVALQIFKAIEEYELKKSIY